VQRGGGVRAADRHFLLAGFCSGLSFPSSLQAL
jgi:hypothetical protein